VLGVLIARRKKPLHQSSKFKKNMSHDFFRDLEPWRRRQQIRRYWKGAKGGERNKFKIPY
jgi:hypothetical protein